jgi:flagellar protein FliL
MADDDTQAKAPKSGGGGAGALLVNGAITFVFALLAVVVGGFVNGKLHPAQELVMTADGKLALKPEAKGGEGKDGKGDAHKAAFYYAFDPAFVVNFDDQQAVRFLQLQIEVLVRDEHDVDAVKLHSPVIRNNLLMLMNGRDYHSLMNREGKEKLRQECLAEVQRILKEQTGKPLVEDLFFTSFVVQ